MFDGPTPYCRNKRGRHSYLPGEGGMLTNFRALLSCRRHPHTQWDTMLYTVLRLNDQLNLGYAVSESKTVNSRCDEV